MNATKNSVIDDKIITYSPELIISEIPNDTKSSPKVPRKLSNPKRNITIIGRRVYWVLAKKHNPR